MLTQKQIEFCEAIASGQSGAEAYALAYKNNNKNTGKAKAWKMLKQAEIIEKIEELQSLNRKIVEMAQTQSIGKVVLPKIISNVERMGMLTQIALGQISVKRVVTSDDKTVVIETWPSFTQRIIAIAALNRMDGSEQIGPEAGGVEAVQTLNIE